MFLKSFQLKPVMLFGTMSLAIGFSSVTEAAAEQSSSPITHIKTANQRIVSIYQALPAGVTPYYGSLLTSVYRQHHSLPMWGDDQAIRGFEQQLSEVALSGVQPQFARWLSLLSRNDLSSDARDVILSDALLGYLQFVSAAPAQGESWFYGPNGFHLSAPSTALIDRWLQAVNHGTTQSFIDGLVPQHPQYRSMQKALVVLLADNKPWPKLDLSRTLRPGDSDPSVPQLRQLLVRGGWLSEAQAAVATVPTTSQPVAQQPAPSEQRMLAPAQPSMLTPASSGPAEDIYSDALVSAVKRFQHWQGLTDDGVIGLKTREWLNITPHQRATLLALNMQRLRLLPDDMHNGIMVNIANYTLNYYVDGKTILSSRVIVGRPDRKTPLMRSALNSVVLNPTWTVPNTLIREDLVPKLRRDPSYLEKHNFTLYSGWGANATAVNPSSVNWQTVSATAFPYRVQQSPGPQNALGRYKFNMPSSDAIYLHDTPNHGLFEQDIRAISSGCVRINKAAQLAGILLKDVGWDQSRIASTIDSRVTRPIAIRHRIPVNLYYLTAWISDDGQAQFRTDIYSYDQLARGGWSSLANAEKFLL
ncbi:L,D-transpeptidase [Rosenbergiella australiborealis]|uniref:L,D-transpeptidase n=1 Tax=Rosenbergiella australiborealis TaxID=1544696 RepID=A0ABS5T3L6_9GAMM|nr:L,D-transpeptidase [Rosenbergiella australiborealis]MBT0726944.1 L,D-transpeptidase [Rosenbergiella australiborealis]